MMLTEIKGKPLAVCVSPPSHSFMSGDIDWGE